LAVASLVLGSWQLGHKSFWLDEAFTWSDIGLTWGALVAKIGTESTHQAVYIVLLKLWSVLGQSEAILRWPSVLASASLAPMVWSIGRATMSRDAAAIAALLMLFHPFALQYAQEARAYALSSALATLSSLLLLELLRRPTRRIAAGYTLVTALLVFTQLHAAALVAAHALVFAWAARREPSHRNLWFVAWTAAAVLASPAVLVALNSKRGLIDWIEPLSLEQFNELARAYCGSTGWLGAAAWFGLVLVGGWFLLQRSLDSQRVQACSLVLWAGVPVIAVIALSLLRPMLLPRYLLFTLPAVCLLTAAGVSALRRRAAVLGLAALLVLGEVYGLRQWFGETTKEEWRQAAQSIEGAWREGDVVASYAWFGLEPLTYYRQRLNARYQLVDLAGGAYDRGSKQPPPHAGKVHDLALKHPRVWVVLNHLRGREGGISPNVASLERLLRQRYRLTAASPYYGLMVQLWERRESP
jgi:mannosyltransferase